MPHPRVGGDDDAGAGHLGPPAQVEVLTHGHDAGVEAPELGHQVGPDQHAAARGHEDLPHTVVLAVVDLGALDPVDDRPGLVGVHPDVQQDERVVPAHHLRGHDPGVGPERLLDHEPHCVGVGRAVVVADQVERRPLDDAQHLVGGDPEGEWLIEPADEGVREHPGDPRGRVPLPARGHHEHGQLGIVLRGQGPEGVFQPRSGVPGDDHRHHRRCTRWHQDAEANPPELRPAGGTTFPKVLATVMQS